MAKKYIVELTADEAEMEGRFDGPTLTVSPPDCFGDEVLGI